MVLNVLTFAVSISALRSSAWRRRNLGFDDGPAPQRCDRILAL
jgi:hypothetical protein